MLIGLRATTAGGTATPETGKAIIFQSVSKSYGQKPAAVAKMKKSIFFCIY